MGNASPELARIANKSIRHSRTQITIWLTQNMKSNAESVRASRWLAPTYFD